MVLEYRRDGVSTSAQMRQEKGRLGTGLCLPLADH